MVYIEIYDKLTAIIASYYILLLMTEKNYQLRITLTNGIHALVYTS